MSSANDLAAARPSRSRMPANSGTKAAFMAPSANSRRMKLGSLKAMKKASAAGLAPRMAAIRMSRVNPSTREPMV